MENFQPALLISFCQQSYRQNSASCKRGDCPKGRTWGRRWLTLLSPALCPSQHCGLLQASALNESHLSRDVSSLNLSWQVSSVIQVLCQVEGRCGWHRRISSDRRTTGLRGAMLCISSLCWLIFGSLQASTSSQGRVGRWASPAHFKSKLQCTVVSRTCLDTPATEPCTAMSSLHVTLRTSKNKILKRLMGWNDTSHITAVYLFPICPWGRHFSHWIWSVDSRGAQLISFPGFLWWTGRQRRKMFLQSGAEAKFQCLASAAKGASAHWLHGQSRQGLAIPQQSLIFAKCCEIFHWKTF